MKVNAHSKGGHRTRWYLVLSLIPMAIGLAWGTYFGDSAYVTFYHARNLAVGQGLAEEGQSLLRAPLYALILWLPARLGIPLPQASLILSALGWSVVAAAVHAVGQAMQRPVAALVAAAFVAFNPVIASTLGTEIPWVVALAWIASVATVKRRWDVQTSALALMLGAHFDWITMATTALMLVTQWIKRRRFPLRATLTLAIVVLVGGLTIAGQVVAPFSSLHLDLAECEQAAQQLFSESDLYWLALPPMVLGLLATGTFQPLESKRRPSSKAYRDQASGSTDAPPGLGAPLRSYSAAARRVLVPAFPQAPYTFLATMGAGLLWGAVAVLSGGPVVGALMTTLGMFLVGLGIDWTINWIEAHEVDRLNRLVLMVSVMLVAGLPLGIAQATSFWQRHQSRPVIRQALEQQAGEWLSTHSEPTAAVLGSARVGYLANRVILPWDGSGSSRTELAKVLNPLTENPPDYCVSFESIGWDHLMKTVWFRELYTPLQRFESTYDVTAPLTIWGYRRSAFDLGERQPLNVRLPGEVDLVGYKYWPSRIQPGDGVYVTLFLKATQPVTESFRSVVQILSPNNELVLTQRDMLTPHSVLADWWQPGQVIAERFVLTGTADITIGAYHLGVSVMSPDEASFVSIYQNEDTSPLDRITLGYLVVPWQGETDQAKPVKANLGDQITLLGFESPDDLSPGTEFDVVLYWEAHRPPEDDYVVFVHLLDGEGQIVTSHDGPPLEGRYPTSAWLPGDVVPDTHHLALDPGIPAGTYQLQVGMYRWPSLERLSVWDGQGVEQPNRTIVLQSVEVQSN